MPRPDPGGKIGADFPKPVSVLNMNSLPLCIGFRLT